MSKISRYCTDAIRERFLSRFSRGPGCWIWSGGLSPGGYGHLRFKKPGTRKTRNVLAHRLAWFVFNGEDPGERCVLHKCDTPGCVNPDHLFLGTQLDNIEDCKKKQRIAAGENHKWSKLTESDVLQIRAQHEQGVTQREIAERFGVVSSNVCKIINRKTWKYI